MLSAGGRSAGDEEFRRRFLGFRYAPPQALCLRPLARAGKQFPPKSNSLRSFTGGVIDALLDIQDILLKTNPGDERRSVFINDLGVKFTDFELSDQTKHALIDQARIATTEYLDKPRQPLPEIKRLWRRA